MRKIIKEIASELGVTVPYENTMINNLLTDSRELEEGEGTLFFAIRTVGNDGHRYIPDLYRRGVRNFVVTNMPVGMEDAEDANFLVVPDVIEALQKITRRGNEFKGELLAITGSRGKTTLKEWLYQLMEPLGDIARSPRSFNSRIGVPLSMWSLGPDARIGIIEAGISKVGEMESLRECIEPDGVIITNVGDAHSEGFPDIETKAAEKARLGAKAKYIISSADNRIVVDAIQREAGGAEFINWSFKNPAATLFIECLESGTDISRFRYRWKGKTYDIEAPVTTDADRENMANALAFMLNTGVEPDIIKDRFLHLHKIGTRLNVTEGVNGSVLVVDSYTSDYSSLRPALHFARRREVAGHGLTLIMSDLHHETTDPKDLYKRVAALVRSSGVSRFIGIGESLMRYRSEFDIVSEFYKDVDDFLKHRSASDFAEETILLKGSPEAGFERIAEVLETRRHETVLEVNLDSIVSNYNYFRSLVPTGTGIICMVKASGYGAGSYEVAKTLQDSGAAYLAVAVLDEGIELRRKGITMPIMVMNPRVANYATMFANRLEPEIYSREMLADVIREARKNKLENYPIHIKLDTGMHRMGFIEEELPNLMDMLHANRSVRATTVFSHLATADCPELDDYTQMQLRLFGEWTDYMESRPGYRIERHILNSAGILRFPEYHYDYVRLGIGLYGANTLPPEIEKPLATVSTLRTVVIAVREWKKGETIGYGRKGILNRDSRVATIPIGYADGMNRHFGNGGISVYINGSTAPTIGNICMDACMIDVTGIECKVGDTVEIFGPNVPLSRLAEVLDTIPYEILTSVSPRVKRVYYRE